MMIHCVRDGGFSGDVGINQRDLSYMRGSKGESGVAGDQDPPQLKYHENIGFLSNTGPDPQKITKLPNQHSKLGHHRPVSETPF